MARILPQKRGGPCKVAINGSVEASHFVFSALRPKFRWNETTRLPVTEWELDPSRPVGSWRTAWRSLTKKAGLRGLRFHDLRHTAISALGEVGVPDRVQGAISESADVTKRVTKSGEVEVIPAQVVEKDGRPVRARTADLYRVKVAL